MHLYHGAGLGQVHVININAVQARRRPQGPNCHDLEFALTYYIKSLQANQAERRVRQFAGGPNNPGLHSREARITAAAARGSAFAARDAGRRSRNGSSLASLGAASDHDSCQLTRRPSMRWMR
jgi:hypothetical protein